MLSHEWIEILRLIPPDQHTQLVVVTNNGVELSIDLLIRTDPGCLIFRGRVCGQSDDGRLFFVPYDQITFVHLNRSVKEDEIREMLGPVMSFEAAVEPVENHAPPEPELHSELAAAFLPSPATPTPHPSPLSRPTVAPPPIVAPPTPRPVPPPPMPVAEPANGKSSILEKLRAQRKAMKGPPR